MIKQLWNTLFGIKPQQEAVEKLDAENPEIFVDDGTVHYDDPVPYGFIKNKMIPSKAFTNDLVLYNLGYHKEFTKDFHVVVRPLYKNEGNV